MNSKSSETSDPYRLLLDLTDKINFKRSDKYVALSNLSMYYIWKNIKSHIRTINIKHHIQHEIEKVNYLMDHILYQKFKISLNIVKKTWRKDY